MITPDPTDKKPADLVRCAGCKRMVPRMNASVLTTRRGEMVCCDQCDDAAVDRAFRNHGYHPTRPKPPRRGYRFRKHGESGADDPAFDRAVDREGLTKQAKGLTE